MRIDAYNQISQVYGTNGKTKTNAATKSSSKDKVEISHFGKDLQVAKQAVAKAPDIRESKVAELKSKVDSGTYEVSADSFAAKILADYNRFMN